MIEEKIEHGGEAAPVAVKKKKPTNVVELASVLQQKNEVGEGRQQNPSDEAKKGRIELDEICPAVSYPNIAVDAN
jgi:hypothetical protein